MHLNLHEPVASKSACVHCRLLEEVARMPYFSYVSMLHLYETLGWWRAGADLRKIQYAAVTPVSAAATTAIESTSQMLRMS
jgi:hypothetical protein